MTTVETWTRAASLNDIPEGEMLALNLDGTKVALYRLDSGEVYAASNKEKAGQPKFTQGSLYGRLTNFVNRLETKINDRRLDFFLGERSKSISFEETLRSILGYSTGKQHNVTIIDLSGVRQGNRQRRMQLRPQSQGGIENGL